MVKSFFCSKCSKLTNSFFSGGIRGIAQIEMLKAIEAALGGDLPIQAFFDLIVGTG